MLIAVVGALLAFTPAAEPAGSSQPAPVAQPAPAAKPKMVRVCERVPDPGARVPKRICRNVEQKEEAEEKAPAQPAGQ